MNSTITVIYENGVLRPLAPLSLPDKTRVQIYVQQVLPPADADAHRRVVREALIAAGLSLPGDPAVPTSHPIPAERRDELAHLFASDRPLSELIDEEREGR